MASFLETYGLGLHSLGYKIVPIIEGTKACKLTGWQSMNTTEDDIRGWPLPYTGCGIISAHTVGVDIDCRDEDLTAYMIDFTRRMLGHVPHRIGMSPKALLPYRCETPFAKVISAAFLSSDGQKHQLEILGAGQQFVAAHIHPDTGKPYIWHYADGATAETLTIPRADLPVITEDDARALIAVFEFQCQKRGWQQEGGASRRTERRPATSPCRRYTEAQARDMLAVLDPSMPYDDWLKVGMALKHGGFPVGLWDEWSRKSPKYEEGVCLKKWPSFSDGGQA